MCHWGRSDMKKVRGRGRREGTVQHLGLLEGACVAEVEEIEDAVGVDAHGAVVLGLPLCGGAGVGAAERGGGLGALPLLGIGDARHLSRWDGNDLRRRRGVGGGWLPGRTAQFGLPSWEARPRAGSPIKRRGSLRNSIHPPGGGAGLKAGSGGTVSTPRCPCQPPMCWESTKHRYFERI